MKIKIYKKSGRTEGKPFTTIMLIKDVLKFAKEEFGYIDE